MLTIRAQARDLILSTIEENHMELTIPLGFGSKVDILNVLK